VIRTIATADASPDRARLIFLGGEPAQPDGTAAGPQRADGIAEDHCDQGRPQRDVAEDAKALGAELSQGGDLTMRVSKLGHQLIGDWPLLGEIG
jgi:hypothetical protein